MLFMTPSDPAYGGTRPQIAKGSQDPGESAIHAALREAQEELGLRASNIKRTSNTPVSQVIGNSRETYQLTVYAVEIQDPAEFDQPHYETGSVHWMTLEDFLVRGRPNQAGLVKKVQELINSEIS